MEECTHSQTEPRIRTKSNGTVSVAIQCLTCGFSRGEKPKSGFNLSVLKPFDDQLLKNYIEGQQTRHRQAADQKSAEWWAKYNTYLQSEHWKRIRKIVLERDQNCQVCFTEWSAQAHHLSYDSFSKWGMSFAIECIGICEKCHKKLHA